MRDSDTLISQARKALKPSSTGSPTAAGLQGSSKTSERPPPTRDHVDAVSHVFVELELAYHNQFHKAFPTARHLAMAKQLWLDALADFTPAQIASGGRRAIQASDYLPSLHVLRKHCQPQPEDLGLPHTRAAFEEACRAPSPKSAHAWSHPAVYEAGRQSGWALLAGEPERQSYPVFERNYQLLCERVLAGEDLAVPVPPALPERAERQLSNAERKARMRQLRDELGI